MYQAQNRNREEICVAIKDRDDHIEKAIKLEKQLEKIKNAPRPVTVHLSEENLHSSRSTRQQT